MGFNPEPLRRVVIADDHPIVLAAFVRLLKPFCEVVATVSCGHDAVDAVIRLKPDVLVVDLMMPDFDGLEVCRRVKKTVPATHIVIVTSFADPQVQALALYEGAVAFVPKQHGADILVSTIQQIFASMPGDTSMPGDPARIE